MTLGTEQRKLAAIMFTDMVGYSALSQSNEALALELLEEHRRVVRGLLSKHGGREVKTTGDGFLLEFPSALAAVQGAVEIQNALHERNQVSPSERQFRIRIGIHVGDVVMRDGDIHGDGVNIAARIEPLAAAGGICVSEDVERQVRNKLPQLLTALGPAELKNIVLPVVVHRVTMPWETPSSSPGNEAHSQRGTGSQSLLTSAATRFGGIAALALIAAGVGWWLFHPPGQTAKQAVNPPTNAPGSPAAAATSATGQKSIAVLPFANTSADKSDDSFSDGITDELITTLQKVQGLRVQGRMSSFFFKGKNETPQRVGEQLNVEHLLHGSVSRAGTRLRISADLVTAASGFSLWSTNYDRELSDTFAIRTEVAQQVAQALKIQLGMEETRSLAQKPTQNPEAHRLYLLGRYHFGKNTEASLTNAMQHFHPGPATGPDLCPRVLRTGGLLRLAG